MDRQRVYKLVLGFLEEEGFSLSAAAFSKESSLNYVAGKHGELLALLDEHSELKRETVERPLQQQEHAELLALAPENEFCNEELVSFEGLHTANIISCCMTSEEGQPTLFTASADSTLKRSKVTLLGNTAMAEDTCEVLRAKGPLLSVSANPRGDLVAVGGMDGSVLLSSLDGSTTVSCGKHKKYVVRTTWSSCGRFLASASYDKTIHLYAVEGVAEGGVRTLHTLQLVGAPEAIAFGQDDEGHVQLFAGVRDDHRIHKIDVESGHATYINMNLLGDEFVSFTAMDLAVHQRTGRLAVATDKDRVLVISLATNHILTTLYGASNDGYSNPRCCWHPSGSYLYATSQTHEILTWFLGTQAVVSRLQGHTSNIRDLVYNSEHKVLMSCGFDKTVRLWYNDVDALDIAES